MKRKSAKEKRPLVEVLLIMSLLANITLNGVAISRYDRRITPAARAAKQAMAIQNKQIELQTKKRTGLVPKNAHLIKQPGSKSTKTGSKKRASLPPNAVRSKKEVMRELEPRKQTAQVKSTTNTKETEREEETILFLPTPVPYRVATDTTLVTRDGRMRVFIPKGTTVNVAGFRQNRAYVISRHGNPEGFIDRSVLE